MSNNERPWSCRLLRILRMLITRPTLWAARCSAGRSTLGEQEHQALPRFPGSGSSVVVSLVTIKVAPSDADDPGEAARVRGESIRFTGREDHLGEAVDHDPLDGLRRWCRMPADHRARACRGPERAHRHGDRSWPGGRGRVEVPAEGFRHADDLAGGVLEGDVEAAFSLVEAFGDEAQPEDRLADPKGPTRGWCRRGSPRPISPSRPGDAAGQPAAEKV